MSIRTRLLTIFFACLIGLVCSSHAMAGDEEEPMQTSEQELYFAVEELNQGMPEGGEHHFFDTPRSTVEHFLLSARSGNYREAARSFNLNQIAENEQSSRAIILAEELYYVVSAKLRITLKDIPDRPDGAVDSEENTDNPLAGKPRRSIKIGSIGMDLSDVAIRIERFKVPDAPPVWLFSPRTVENIERMYRQHGPGPLMEYLPDAVELGIVNNDRLWYWGTVVVAIGISLAIGWIVQTIVAIILKHAGPHAGMIGNASALPLGFLTASIAFHVMIFSLLSLPGSIAHTIYPLAGTLIVVAATWLLVRTVRAYTHAVSLDYQDQARSEEEGIEARNRLTRLAVIKHVGTFLALCIGLAFGFQQFHLFENFSLSFLASAGVAGVVLGIASREVLGNIMAGIQIGLSQPASIGDSIYFEGHWGWVEDLTYTYVAIRTWDSRRLVIPVSYFVAHPFENWSMKSARTIRPIFLYVDYNTDVAKVRARFEDLLRQSSEWDHEVPPILEVTELKEQTMELRALCGAKDPTSAWKLHCRIREQLIEYLRELEDGRFLPKQRLLLSQDGEAGSIRRDMKADVSARDRD